MAGNIGYAVRPEKRNRGYATKMLGLGIKIAAEKGFEKLLCVCDDDNYASEKVILNNGGVLESTLYDESDGVTLKRYWVSCKNG